MAREIGPAGGDVQVAVPGASAVVSVPAGAFNSPVQVELTAPSLAGVTAGLAGVGFPGSTAMAGLGFKALTNSGQPVTGTFAKPVSITLANSNFGSTSDKIIDINGTKAASVLPSTVSSGKISFSISSDPDLAVIAPPAGASGAPPGSTSVPTGKPFAWLVLLAGLMIAAGAGVLAMLGWSFARHLPRSNDDVLAPGATTSGR